MKKRATNVKVTKRSSASGASSTLTSQNGGANNIANGNGKGGTGGGKVTDEEYMGVVSLVQTERHYGFIDMVDQDERVFFHLSEVVKESNSGSSTSPQPGAVAIDRSVDNCNFGVTSESSGDTAAGSMLSVPGNDINNAVVGPIISRGQEVAFRIGQRQGRRLGLCVRKLPAGTLTLEECLPTRFVGVIAVAPTWTGGAGEMCARATGGEKVRWY